MARWFDFRGSVSRTPERVRFRPQLEGFEERVVPDSTLINGQDPAVVSQDSDTSAVVAASTGATIDFTNMLPAGQTGLNTDTITITITPTGVAPTVITVNVANGSTPANVATAVQAAMNGQNAKYGVTVSGNSVSFTITGNTGTVTATNTNNANGAPVVTTANVP